MAIAPINRNTAIAPVAYSRGKPNNSVCSEPGVKKSMIRPMAQGNVKLTAVEMTRQITPIVKRRHCGLASETSLTIEATSGVVAAAVEGVLVGGATADIGGGSAGVDGEAGADDGAG